MNKIAELRRKVMTIANKIRKTNKLSLSQAVKRAWDMAKMGLIIKVAGVTQGNRQVACEHLQRYDIADIKVELVREANNEYDKNAVAVIVYVKDSRGYKLGYIPASTAAILSVLIDKGIQINALFKEIRGKYFHYMNWGAVIEIMV